MSVEKFSEEDSPPPPKKKLFSDLLRFWEVGWPENFQFFLVYSIKNRKKKTRKKTLPSYKAQCDIIYINLLHSLIFHTC